MTNENYITYLLGTVSDYPQKYNKYLLKLFTDERLVQKDSQLTLDALDEEQLFDISDMALNDAVKTTLSNKSKAITLFEKWEFVKDYKYSVLFEAKDFEQALKIIEAYKLNQYGECDYNELQFTGELFTQPYLYRLHDKIILKYNKTFSAYDPITENEILLKYPFIVVFHEMFSLVEFRFDGLRKIFLSERNEQTVHPNQIKEIRDKLLNMGIELTELDLSFMKNLSDSSSHVKVLAEYRKLPNGGNAQLEVGNNEDYVLPIIGDLKDLIRKYESELHKVPLLKDALSQFIFENDELADYTWIEVIWPNEIKTRSIRVKFIFNYKGKEYTLLQHYYNNVLIGMERMNYVTKYINENKKNPQSTAETPE